MKTSFCTNVWKPELIIDQIPKLASLGYDGLEFWQPHLVQMDLDRLERVLDESGIAVSQLCPYFNFTGTQEESADTMKVVEEYIDLSRRFGSKLIRVFTGKVGSADATPEQWSAGVRGLKQACESAAPYGIGFALESHRNSLMDTSESTLRLLDDVGMDNLGVNLQAPLNNEPLYDTVDKLGGRTIHMHAHNYDENGKGTYLDGGLEDFEKFLAAVHAKGFDGYVSVEHASFADPLEIAERNIKYLKEIIPRIEG